MTSVLAYTRKKKKSSSIYQPMLVRHDNRYDLSAHMSRKSMIDRNGKPRKSASAEIEFPLEKTIIFMYNTEISDSA